MSHHLGWLFPFLFPLFRIAITGTLAARSGWPALSKAFPSPGHVEGERFRFASGAIGREGAPVSYGGCLFVTVGDAGIGLSVLLPLRLLSPPLFIPWRAVAVVEVKRTFVFSTVTIRLRGRDTVIRFRGAPGSRVQSTWARVGRPAD